MSHKARFSRFLAPERLHFAAHSHHLWPDVTFDAQQQAWFDAARLADAKWDHIFGTVIPEAQGHVAHQLGLPDPATVVFAPNTHELVTRIVSNLPSPVRIVTTDGEFHSFRRQTLRWEEAGEAAVVRVAVEPFASFPERLVAAAGEATPHLVYLSHVLYDSGYVVPDLVGVVRALPDDAFVVVDGYHGFMALPTDLGSIAARAFYVSGGYKYAMAGEGACFLHCPPGYAPRPVDTGWFAGFGTLEEAGGGVGYAPGGARFWGATFDPSGLYRFNAVQRMLADAGLDVAAIHRHVTALEARFVGALGDDEPLGRLVPGWTEVPDRGHFLTFESSEAALMRKRLAQAGVVTDRRGDRLRIGFGLYHDGEDVDSLVDVIRRKGIRQRSR